MGDEDSLTMDREGEGKEWRKDSKQREVVSLHSADEEFNGRTDSIPFREQEGRGPSGIISLLFPRSTPKDVFRAGKERTTSRALPYVRTKSSSHAHMRRKGLKGRTPRSSRSLRDHFVLLSRMTSLCVIFCSYYRSIGPQ